MAPPWAPDPREWFEVAEIEPGIVLVGEPGFVYSWLLVGRDDRLLLDSGLGVSDIRAAVVNTAAGIADEPLLVNSHAHFDHVGGNALFARRAIHPAGAERLVQMNDRNAPWEYRRLDLGSEETRAYATAAYENWRALREVDRRFHFLLGPEEVVREWPSVPRETFAPPPPPPTQLVEEGHRFDLGARELHVLHTPGHATEHICLLDEREGILFAQDHAYYGPHYLCFEGSDLEAWVASAARLADDLYGSIRIVYTAHCLRWSAPPKLLRELAEAGERVLAGDVELESGAAPGGGAALAADFAHFSIVLPGDFSRGR
jgi:glyoxylase-like metal-dependent hydrolase (beta-lactamase superfamily II)